MEVSKDWILQASNNGAVVIIGPTAAGKDTLLRELVSMGANSLLSHTTRNIREGEVEGVEYYFVNDAEFEAAATIQIRTYSILGEGARHYGMSADVAKRNGVCIMDVDGYTSLKQWRDERGLETTAVLLDIDKDTARDRYLNRGGDEAEFERRWDADEVWLSVVRELGIFTFAE